jgi:hypothetical protein
MHNKGFHLGRTYPEIIDTSNFNTRDEVSNEKGKTYILNNRGQYK